MKKIYSLLLFLMATYGLNAQLLNPGMETWRNSTSGTSTIVNIHAPIDWYGYDSLVVADLEFAASIGVIPHGTDYHADLFQESTHVHSGSYSAKVITVKEDTLGLLPGALTNAQMQVNLTVLLAGHGLAAATSFTGGTSVTGTIVDTISAWVEYLPGIDSSTHLMGGLDTGLLTITAIGKKGGVDTTLGTGTLQILPSDSFVQIKAAIIYNDTSAVTDTLRITFSTSGGGKNRALDSSTLYVDDVSFIMEPNLVPNVKTTAEAVKIYPNPAAFVLYLEGSQSAGLTFNLYAVSGRVAACKTLTGNDNVDIANLPEGLYFYSVSDNSGNTLQRGKVSVVR